MTNVKQKNKQNKNTNNKKQKDKFKKNKEKNKTKQNKTKQNKTKEFPFQKKNNQIVSIPKIAPFHFFFFWCQVFYEFSCAHLIANDCYEKFDHKHHIEIFF